MAVLCGGAALLFAVQGDLLLAVANAVVALTNIAHLAVSPLSRPDDVARALRASRGVEASSP